MNRAEHRRSIDRAERRLAVLKGRERRAARRAERRERKASKP